MSSSTLTLHDSRSAEFLEELKAEKARRQEREAERQRTIKQADAIRTRCKSLAQFVKEAWHILEPVAVYVHSWHIDAICAHLEAVTRGEINRLLINVPPGSMKSRLVSVMWPAWEWAYGHASYRYITTSFAADATTRDTRYMRDLVNSDWYQTLYPHVQLVRKGDTAISNTATGFRESSPFGSLTSKRGDRLIIDDPHSIKTAESDTQRNEITLLFREGALNRLNDQKKSAIVVVMQRLHERDMSGVILELEMGFVHLCIPMEFEVLRRCKTAIGWSDPRTKEGELLDPVRFPPSVVAQMHKDMGAHAYAGQYQQRPSAREGGMFKRTDFCIITALPAGATRKVRAWDLAGSVADAGADPDWTVGLKMSTDGSAFYVEDVIRFRESSGKVRMSIRNTASQDGRMCRIVIPQDPGQAGKDQAASIIAQNAGYVITAERETGDKETRAEPYASQTEAGNVYLLEGPWNEAYIEELCLADTTSVITMRGTIPISDVRRGDMVVTRSGWRRVSEAKCTSREATLCRISFSNGGSLCCTLNHPILVPGSNFKKAGQLKAGDRLSRFIAAPSSSSHSAIPRPIFAALKASSIASFGKPRGGRSLADITSTTLTMILSTTMSRISSAFRHPSILFGIGRGRSRESSASENASFAKALTKRLKALDRELAQKNAGIAISAPSGIRPATNGTALIAETNSAARLASLGVFVAARAAIRGLLFALESLSLRKSASNAKRASFRNHAVAVFADDLVVSDLAMLPGRHAVYNLEVEDVHEFVAAGILVHNCSFPKGYKDQVDASSAAFKALTAGPAPMKISKKALTASMAVTRRR